MLFYYVYVYLKIIFLFGIKILQVFTAWAQMMGLCRDRAAMDEMKSLLNAWEENPKKWTPSFYAWNVSMNRYEYLDGSVRVYVHKSLRK